MAKEFDVILPCYNPSKGWEKVVVDNYMDISQRLPEVKINLILVNDGSLRGFTEESVCYIKEKTGNVKVVSYAVNRGKGYAVREGVKNSTSDDIIYSDYDFPYTTDSFVKVVKALSGGADVVIAIRGVLSYQYRLPLFRKILSFGSHLINIIVFRIKVRDTQGGLKGIGKASKPIFLSTTIDTFLFDTQFIYKATHAKNIRIETVKASIKPGITISSMGFKTMTREFKNVFKILTDHA